MHRYVIALTPALLALASASSAAVPQTLHSEAPGKVPGAIKDAGIYHVSTGTWTRTGGSVAQFGPDTVYSNTAAIGYFGFITTATPGTEFIDEGGIPGTTNGNPFPVAPDRDVYTVNGFQIGYCAFGAPGSAGWQINFYSDYDPCSTPGAPAVATVDLAGLPAGGCWFVTVDLEGGGEFCFESDGGPAAGTWDNNETLDSFGWGHVYTGTDPVPGAGFILAGDPAATDPNWSPGQTLPIDGTGTYYGPMSLCAGNTGYLTQDGWWIEGAAPTTSGCVFFGGYNNNPACGVAQPYSSWFMEIYADLGECGDSLPFTTYCMSNPNSTGINGTLRITGDQVAANDDVQLIAENLPTSTFGFFISSLMPGLTMNPAGSQGNLCLSGQIGRFVGPGQIQNSGPSGSITLDTTTGVWSMSAMPQPLGAVSVMSGDRWHFQLWHRDSVMMTATSNFTDAVFVDWL